MKILHCSDLHIGKSRSLPNYLGRQQQMLNEIKRIAVDENVDLVLVVGDIFESKNVFPKEKDMLLKWALDLDTLAQSNGFKVIIMDGNHDLVEAGYTQVRFLAMLQNTGRLRATEIVEIEPKLLHIEGDVYVGAVPSKYYKTDELNDIVRGLYQEAEKLTMEPVFVAMVHECILGSTNSLGWMADKGPKLDPTIPCTYWSLGDIHKPQHVQGMKNAWYSGSPIQHDFGDDEKRGVLIVDLKEPTKPRLVPLQGVTKLITVKATCIEDIPTGDIVRVEADAQTIAKLDLPDNVVGFKPVVSEEKAIAALESDDMLSSLTEVLAAQGMNEDDQKDAVRIAQKLRASL